MRGARFVGLKSQVRHEVVVSDRASTIIFE